MDKKLNKHLKKIQETAQERVNKLVEQKKKVLASVYNQDVATVEDTLWNKDENLLDYLMKL